MTTNLGREDEVLMVFEQSRSDGGASSEFLGRSEDLLRRGEVIEKRMIL